MCSKTIMPVGLSRPNPEPTVVNIVICLKHDLVTIIKPHKYIYKQLGEFCDLYYDNYTPLRGWINTLHCISSYTH